MSRINIDTISFYKPDRERGLYIIFSGEEEQGSVFEFSSTELRDEAVSYLDARLRVLVVS